MVVLRKYDETRCPHRQSTWAEGVDMCELVDKYCLLETGDECDVYKEYLRELEDEL